MAKGLGSGLGALFGNDSMREVESGVVLPLSKIEPRTDQPRGYFNEARMDELVKSIKDHGLIQPITVRPIEGGFYQIVAGERRWRAAREAGLYEVPVCIVDADDQETAEIALIENIQREDLTPMEEARAYERLMKEFRLTQEQVADKVGKSRSVIANSLRMLRLPKQVQTLVENGRLSQSHARLLLELDDPQKQIDIGIEAASEELSVKETETLVKRATTKRKPPRRPDPRRGADGIDYMSEVERELTNVLKTKVTVSARSNRGRIEIEYYDAEDFERLYRALMSVKGDKA